jgi:hypothetical protein
VCYVTTAGLVHTIVEADDDRQLARNIAPTAAPS